MRTMGAAIVAMLVTLAAVLGARSITRDDELDVETGNRVVRNWSRIVHTCGEREPSPPQLNAATRSLAVLLVQYGRTPERRVQLVESSEEDSMREVLRLIARRDPKDAAACEPIRQAARNALHYDP